MLGVDTDALVHLSAELRRAAATVADRAHRWAQGAAAWDGADGRRVGAELERLARSARATAGGLSSAASQLRSEVEQQRRASRPAPTVTTERLIRSGDGRAVVRVGPTDAATVVAVVPGVGADLGDAERLLAQAGALHWALSATPTAGGTAVVAWLGYDPPDTVVAGVDPRPALVGARTLAADVQRWQADGARTVVLVGHSYGALVAGRAAAGRAAAGSGAVDGLVQLGSPGAGPSGPLAWRALRRPGLRWAAARAPGDPIALVQPWATAVHGPDPTRLAVRLPTSQRGHAAYLRDPLLLGALDRFVDDLARSAPPP